MTALTTIELLDPTDPEQLRAYEEAFYAAFVTVTSNRLVRKLWRWDDDAKRLATVIPYEDQVIHLRRSATGVINAAVAVNVAQLDFQAKAFGFAPEPGVARWSEIVTFFAPYVKSVSEQGNLVLHVLHDLTRRGFTACYATTAARPLRVYTRYFGLQAIGSAEINGEDRHFLRYTLPLPASKTKS